MTQQLFNKILIANRGEIAVRVMKTCKKLGIKTVAVYSEADADALHVDMADEKLLIGPPPAAESYLVIEKIIEVAKDTGAEAIHPGYGFLSENPKFAKALEAAHIAFIGPNPHAIASMGDKIESKKLAKEAGVNTVPGYLGVIKNADEAAKIAADIGYPVMLKASAGGGGKGMRVAHSEDQLREDFTSTMNEARSAFGDDRVFVEKFIVNPRHIEIQVLADKHGNIIHLGERECSIQRRNQKVIEEAPSPLLDGATRAAMGEQACALGRSVNYDSAGTVEFIADQDKNFYFLEMNTRLQVEHPVTELITGLDLVEQMIRVAAGEKLGIAQNDVTFTGWAMESRIYAEDPYKNFLPSIGRLVRFRPPAEGKANNHTVRVDTGVQEGGEISLYYDPMIAKLCTHGPDRIAAIDHMARALDEFVLSGIAHNIPFLAALMRHERFREGRLSTAFIAEEFEGGFSGRDLSETELRALIGITAYLDAVERVRAAEISGQISVPPKGAAAAEADRVVLVEGEQFPIHVRGQDTGIDVTLSGPEAQRFQVMSGWRPGDLIFRGDVDGGNYAVKVRATDQGWALDMGGVTVETAIGSPRMAELMAHMPEKIIPDTSNLLLCPMPGLVVSIEAEEGQDVKAGEALAVVEAMKMENVLRAERDGKIKAVKAKPGDSLAVDDVILEFE